MRFLPSLLASVVAATALDFTNWHPPIEGDVRSPCPALNSMANHHIIPHSGRNLTPHSLVPLLQETYSLSPFLAHLLAYGALITVPNPAAEVFDLDDLAKHNYIEHDGSLSRADFHLGGDDHTFRPEIFRSVMGFFGGANLTVEEAAAARQHRMMVEKERDPGFVYGPKQMLLSYSETALYYLSMAQPGTGVTPVEFVRVFFEEERLPYAEGWRPPKKEINQFALSSMILRLATATSGKASCGEDVSYMQQVAHDQEFIGHLGGGLATQNTLVQ